MPREIHAPLEPLESAEVESYEGDSQNTRTRGLRLCAIMVPGKPGGVYERSSTARTNLREAGLLMTGRRSCT